MTVEVLRGRTEKCPIFSATTENVAAQRRVYVPETLLHKHLLMGHEFRTAFHLANDGLEGTHFRHGLGGVLQS